MALQLESEDYMTYPVATKAIAVLNTPSFNNSEIELVGIIKDKREQLFTEGKMTADLFTLVAAPKTPVWHGEKLVNISQSLRTRLLTHRVSLKFLEETVDFRDYLQIGAVYFDEKYTPANPVGSCLKIYPEIAVADLAVKVATLSSTNSLYVNLPYFEIDRDVNNDRMRSYIKAFNDSCKEHEMYEYIVPEMEKPTTIFQRLGIK